MKNLKKTLSLVLVVAMICSLFVMTNAAFTDQADIENVAAAEVLTAIGVVTGYTDNSFQPEKILTRAEGAAMVARMLLGADADKQVAGGDVFDDVKANDWHAGYISYCVSEGIIAGYGNGKFGPNDTLTVAQFAKMLLVALGYNAETEGFTGANWASPVGKYVNKLGLVAGATTTVDSDCSRQVAAQMALNTLEATLVKYTQGNIVVESGDSKVTIGGSAAQPDDALTGDKVSNMGDANTVQFAERYVTNLKKDTSASNYGRPDATVWTFRGDVVATVENNSTLLKTYTGTVAKKTLNTLIGTAAQKALKKAAGADGAATLNVWVDGKNTVVDANAYANLTDYFNTKDNVAITGNGVTTEVYMDEDFNVTLVFINTYVAKADVKYNTTSKVLDLTVYGVDSSEADQKPSGDDFAAVKTGKKDQYFLVNMSNGVVADIVAAETRTAAVDTYTMNSSDSLTNITVGGKQYTFSKEFAATVTDKNGTDIDKTYNFALDKDVTVVLDANGYIITFAEAAEEVSTDYLYLYKAEQSTGLFSKKQWAGAVYMTDGTYEEVLLDTIDDAEPQTTDSGWYAYTVNAAGKYVLTTISGTADAKQLTTVTGAAIEFAGSLKANNNTVFMLVDADGEATLYTGYKSMVTLNAKSGETIDAYAITKSGYATYVFIDITNATIVNTAATGNVLFVYGTDHTKTPTADGLYRTYTKVMVNGVKQNVQTVDSSVFATKGLYTDVTYDKLTGYINGATLIDADIAGELDYVAKTSGTTKDTIAYSAGALKVNSGYYEIADDCDVFIDGTVTTAAKLASDNTGKIQAAYYFFTNAEGEAYAIYVVK